MIVNPQLFNYRLITGSLVVTIAVISIFSFSNYQSNQAQQQFLEQEKKLIEIELTEMLKRYDEVSSNNYLMASQLEEVRTDAENTMQSLRIAQNQLSGISKIKYQLSVLEKKNSVLFEDINSVKLKNAELEKEKSEAINELQTQLNINSVLLEKNNVLTETLEKASVLTANSFNVKALNKVFGKITETNKASKTETIEVSFTLVENVFAEKGEKDIYIQILTPDNNVFADKGAINFGDSSLIYSAKKIVSYNNGVLDVSININAEEDDQPLKEGNYYVSVFNKEQKLGSTQLQLD